MDKHPNSSHSRTRRILYFFLATWIIISSACKLPSLPNQSQPGAPGAPGALAQATPTLALATLGPTATPRPRTPQPPALVEAQPVPGSEIGPKEALYLSFNQAMDKNSVEGAIQAKPGLNGKFTWLDDATLSFAPAQPWQASSAVSLTVGTGAQAANGKALLNPVTIQYQIAGPFQLTQSLPAPNAKEVAPASAIVAGFNRPVVSLGADPSAQPTPFTIQPAVAGRGEWLNTSTYIFYPEPALQGGAEYKVTLIPNLVSVEGLPLAGDSHTTWTFSTATPKMLTYTPTGSLRLDGNISITFNIPMDPSSVQANFSVTDPGGQAIKGRFEWDAANTTLTFTPDGLLQRDTGYNLTLSGQAAAAGGAQLGADYTHTFQTFPTLKVTATTPTEGAAMSQYFNGQGGLTIEFSAPVSPKNLKTFFSISPQPGYSSINLNNDGTGAYINGFFDPETAYTLTISPDLVDVWGGKLSGAFQLHFRTPPAVPGVTLPGGSNLLFLTPQDTKLTAQVTNLKKLNLTLGAINLEQYLALIGDNGYQLMQSFAPNAPQNWVANLTLTPNRSQSADLPLQPDGSALSSGLYIYTTFSPSIPNTNQQTERTLLVVSPLQVTFKLSDHQAMVWAVRLADYSPVSGQPVAIYDPLGKQIASGQTDPNGMAMFDITQQVDFYDVYTAVVGSPGQDTFGLATTRWSTGLSVYDFGLSGGHSPNENLIAYVYTERPIYRPGQTVYYRAVVRSEANGRFTIPDLKPVTVEIMGDSGMTGEAPVLSSQDLPLSTYGTFQGAFALPAGALPGYYSININSGKLALGSLSFQVVNYRKPEIDLSATLTPTEIKLGQPLQAKVTANYFFGAPAGNVAVNWTLYSNAPGFDLPQYSVGTLDTGWLSPGPNNRMFFGMGNLVASGQGRTTADGSLVIDIPRNQLPEQINDLQELVLEATASDESGLPVSARGTAKLHPADYYIGVRPDAWSGQAGASLGFTIQTVDWSAKKSPAHALEAAFARIEWTQTGENDPISGPAYTENRVPVSSASPTTDASGLSRLAFIPPDPGTYVLEVSGDGTKTEVLIWVGGPGTPVWPNIPNQHIELTPDATAYQPGQSAKIFIPNPFSQPAPALVSIERGQVMSAKVITLDGSGYTLDLPLNPDDAPNVYVSVTVLGRRPDGSPDFRQGFTNLDVAPTAQILQVKVDIQPTRAGPGDSVTLALKVTDSSGKPVQGEFSAAAVDKAVLALADPNSEPINDFFYGRRSLAVRTSLSLAGYAQRTTYSPGGLGGGGGGPLAPTIRQDLPDIAFWKGDLVTGADGSASVSLTLPDNLTTWQLDLRGLTTDSRTGQAEAQIVTSKDLIVRPQTPRFLVVGDHTRLFAIVNNTTSGQLDVDVSLQGTGFFLDNPSQATQKVTVPANGRASVGWWGVVQDVDAADLTFKAQSGALSDAVRPSNGRLPVRTYSSPQTFSTAGILSAPGDLTEIVSIPPSYKPTGGKLQLELSSSLAGVLFSGIDALDGDMNDDNVTILSRFLPILETDLAFKDLNLDPGPVKSKYDQTVKDGILHLQNNQNIDGGWNWWPHGFDPNATSDPFLSAYILFGLNRAELSGFNVVKGTLDRGRDYLTGNLIDVKAETPTWELDRLAFQLFTLQQLKMTDAARTNALYDNRARLSPWAQALLALTLDAQNPGEPRAATLLSDLQSAAIRSAAGANWEATQESWQIPNTPVFNTAVVAYALASRQPDATLLNDAIRFLASNRQPGGLWGSSYESAWTLLALAASLKVSGDLNAAFNFSAVLNDDPFAQGKAESASQTPVSVVAPLAALFDQGPNVLKLTHENGEGRLYYRADLVLDRPVESAQAINRGLTVSRDYFVSGQDCRAVTCKPVSEIILSGDPSQQKLITVRLTVTLPHDGYNLVVEDNIPAGTEIFNPNLKTSQQGQPAQPEGVPVLEYDPANPYATGWGWWYFDDPQIYDDHIRWSVAYLPAGSYQLTYRMVPYLSGEFRAIPARAWQFFFPDVQGSSAGSIFKITGP